MKHKGHLRFSDAIEIGSIGLFTRKMRTVLTAIGIGIGIAALIAVMGISSSSRADVLKKLDELGTNRLEVAAGSSFSPGQTASLPEESVQMVRRIGAVNLASGIISVRATVRRSDYIPSSETGGIAVYATDNFLAEVLGASLESGRFLLPPEKALPEIVLGSEAARVLGIKSVDDNQRIYVSGYWFTVVGILKPIPLYNNLNTAAFLSTSSADTLFDTELSPSNIFVVSEPSEVAVVRSVLASTANPASPGEVNVSRPSDAIAAKKTVDKTLTALLLGLGGVALLVGAIGIANVMVIGVLERRTEIGVRRALGATKRHIRIQFLTEAILLSGLGGFFGIVIGVAITAGYATWQHIVFSVSPISLFIGLFAAFFVGAVAGLSPAIKASRLSPAEAISPV